MLAHSGGTQILRLVALLLCTILPIAPAAANDAAQPFTCCDDTRITAVVEGYLRVHQSLVGGASDKGATEAMNALAPLLHDRSSMSAPDRSAIRTLHNLVEAARKKSASAIREAFDPISRQVIFLALRHQGGRTTVVEAWCPQVGPWLQADTEAISSPYGETCGRWR